MNAENRPMGAEVRLLAGDAEPWVRRLPTQSPVTVGRSIVRLNAEDTAWLPRELVRFEPCEQGWIARLAGRGVVEVEAATVVGRSRLRQGAELLLTRGWWTLSWTGLDRRCRLEVDVRPPELLPYSAPFILSGVLTVNGALTAVAVGRDQFSPRDRHRLAVAFRHLLEDEPPPVNLAETAASVLGLEGNGRLTMHNLLHRTRRRINRERGPEWELATNEDLGRYLIDVAQAIGPDDLEP